MHDYAHTRGRRGTHRTLWDVVMLLLLVYESFIIPYDLSVGFTVPLSEVPFSS